MKLLIIGSNGMLGKTVFRYLKNEFEVYTLNRKEFDIFRDNYSILKNYIIQNGIEIIINCAGIIRRTDVSVEEMYVVNAYFPVYLDNLSKELGFYLVHPTTDCIFDSDNYGKSKYISENLKNACIIRSSIVGVGEERGLFAWVMKNRGKKIKGYTKHIWNGITTLEFAKNVYKFIKERKIGLVKLGTEPISKYELIKKFCNIFEINIEIEPFENEYVEKIVKSDLVLPSIDEQLRELKEFNLHSR